MNVASIFRSIFTKFFTALKVNQSTKIKKSLLIFKISLCFVYNLEAQLCRPGRPQLLCLRSHFLLSSNFKPKQNKFSKQCCQPGRFIVICTIFSGGRTIRILQKSSTIFHLQKSSPILLKNQRFLYDFEGFLQFFCHKTAKWSIFARILEVDDFDDFFSPEGRFLTKIGWQHCQ